MRLTNIQKEIDHDIHLLRIEHNEYKYMYDRELISTTDWITVSRQITQEIIDLNREYMLYTW